MNAAALALFQKLGFSRSGQIDNLDPDDPELVFFKDVGQSAG